VPFYESVFIARQDITTAQVDGLTETFEKIITDHGGSVKKTEQWGLRSLAYKIKKNRKGYYVLFNLDTPSDAIKEMERQMHINEDVLRFLTTRIDEIEEGPSAVLRAKDRDDDRGRRGPRDFDNKPGFDKKPVDGDKPASGDKPAAVDAAPSEDKAPEAKVEAKTDAEPEKADVAPEKADVAPEKADVAPEKADVADKAGDAEKASDADKEGEDK